MSQAPVDPNDPIQALLSQLDASKQMFNESLNQIFQLRTQVIQHQKMYNDVSNKLKKANEALEAANKKIAELSNPQASDVQPDPCI